MEGNKVMVYAVVALIVGAIVGVGIGYAVFHNDSKDSPDSPDTPVSTDETYSFYLYFGDNDVKTKWYSAEGSDATVAFDKAMKDAGLEYEVSSYGYVGSIDGNTGNGGGWYIAQYLYSDTTKAAANASIGYPTESYGCLKVSNGWVQVSGYDGVEGLKLCEFCSNVYFMSPYNADWTAASPVSTTLWMTSGPFATA